MSKGAEKTGLGPSVLVAIEQYYSEEQRGVHDDIVEHILPSGMRIFVKTMKYEFMRNWMVNSSEKSLPGIWAGMICRKRYFDDKVIELKNDVDSIVNLGAGYDTRFMRLPGLGGLKLYEVDQPNNIGNKVKLIKDRLGNLNDNIQYVAVDFDHQKTMDRLVESGYELNRSTLFLLEGVSQYLTEEGFLDILKMISNAPAGSGIVFTYVLRDLIEGKTMYGWEKGYEKYVVKDKIWLLGYNPDELSELLSEFGMELVEDKSFKDLAPKYIDNLNRNLTSTEIERVAYAVRVDR
ncbi:MAG: class I SAM-dependent methyltransferase [Clostridiales bacterium]|nr:class I SAM-dependent methyltransferase [Clostridiales bacterium]